MHNFQKRLDRVTGYPDEANEPTIGTSSSDDNPIGWYIIDRLPGNERPIHEHGDFIEDIVRDRLERVPGVGEVNVYGGSEQEIQRLDQEKKKLQGARTEQQRLIGIQANSSSKDHAQLDGAEELQQDPLSDWGREMLQLNKEYGVKILGGCCGTDHTYLRYLAESL